MKVLQLTNEYPPNVYGGAGVHIEYLSRELAKLMPVEVRCFGDQDSQDGNLTVCGFETDTSGYGCEKKLRSALAAAQRGLDWNSAGIDADLVHCHTWYAQLGGIIAKLNYGLPLVITTHSLEPLRPWKREQLGGGYDFSSWIERTAIEMADAVIAVSRGTREDVLRLFDVDPAKVHIIYNGIDPDQYRPTGSTAALEAHGVDPSQPYLLFVGRITRQKGITYLVRAIEHMDPGYQVVLCAGAPDTPEIAAEMQEAVRAASAHRGGVIWIEEMLSKPEVIELYSHAEVFCCPSIYEPFGIINLEAMACETAVVASEVGGIPEAVGDAGVLVPLAQMEEAPFAPVDPATYSRDLATAVNALMTDPEKRARLAAAGRRRAVEQFSWSSIAAQTRALYETLVK
ncbi:MAG: glycogen synthase [Verrucomicrobiota bacterium]